MNKNLIGVIIYTLSCILLLDLNYNNYISEDYMGASLLIVTIIYICYFFKLWNDDTKEFYKYMDERYGKNWW